MCFASSHGGSSYARAPLFEAYFVVSISGFLHTVTPQNLITCSRLITLREQRT